MHPKDGLSIRKREPLKVLSGRGLIHLAFSFGMIAGSSISARATPVSGSSGYVGVESLGFLRNSSDRKLTGATLALAPRLSIEGGSVEATGEILGAVFLDDASSATLEVPEAFVGSGPRLMPHHRLYIGRKRLSWSQADEDWSMGVWSPRFLWDPLKPTPIGMTGLFYTYQSKYWKVSAYGSPVSVPERGAPMREDRGKFSSSSPYYVPLPDKVIFQEREIDIRYRINMPGLKETLLRPGAAVSVRVGEEDRGIWSRLSYGFLPIHQPDLTLDAIIDSPSLTLEASVTPRFLSHHLVTSEVGFQDSSWSAYGSLTREIPMGESVPVNRIYQPMGPATIAVLGGTLRLAHGWSFSQQWLNVVEKKGPGPDTDLSVDLYSRFPYRQAVRSLMKVESGYRVSYAADWTYDYLNRSSMLSLDIDYILTRKGDGKTGWSLNLGTDWFSSASVKGLIGQYRGDDRIRGKLSYAF